PLLVSDAWAIPAFSGKLDLDCGQCHIVAPALNDFGEAFRDHGYRIADVEARLPDAVRERATQETAPDRSPAYWPISLRTALGYRLRSRDSLDTDLGEAKLKTRGFGIDRLDVASGGRLADQLAFYLFYRPTLTNTFSQDAEQAGTLESAWLRFNRQIGGTAFSLKMGAFEMDVPVSSRRRVTLSDYPIYGYFTPDGMATDDPDAILNWSRPQLGLEVMGRRPSGLRYSLAIINGTNVQADQDTALDYYGRAAYPLGDHRFGGFVYWGSGPTRFQTTGGGVIPIPGSGTGKAAFYRLGFDGDVRIPPLRLLAVGLYGSDGRKFFGGINSKDATFAGGFLEAQYDVLKDWSTLLVFRYDMIRSLGQGDAQAPKKRGDVDGATVAARYRFLETDRLSVIFHGEYSHVETKLMSVDGNDQIENRVTAAFDVMM
ncbi:MAG: hypothetical protein ABIO65_13040, partial [Nitrospiria bacterium]